MSEEKKKLPPIQPAPVRPFTIRLIDGHFVRVPKMDHTAQTDATRPATTPVPARPPIAAPDREVAKARRTLRLVDGRWVRRGDLAADTMDTHPPAGSPSMASAPSEPVRAPRAADAQPKGKPAPPPDDSWAAAFGTQIDPADLPSEH